MSRLQDDEPLREALQEARARAAVVRQAVIWTPLFLIALGGFLFFFVDEARGGDRGSWFLVGLLGVFPFLFGYMSIQAIRDLLGAPVEREGLVTRRWARTDSFFFRSHYVRVEPNLILRIDPHEHDVREEEYVAVRFYPHTMVAIRFERREMPEEVRERLRRRRRSG